MTEHFMSFGLIAHLRAMTMDDLSAMGSDLKQLISSLNECERDARDVIGSGAAKMLAYWHQHENDLDGLVKFIHDRIHSDSKVNGWKLEQNGRLSLERIVIDRC